MLPAAILTKLLGRKAAIIVTMILKDIAIAAALTVISKLLVLATSKLDTMRKYKEYNINPEDDYVTVRTSVDNGRSRLKRKRTAIPKK